MKITTNNVPRNIIDGYELSTKEREEFDWINFEDDSESHQFMRFKGQVYSLGEFMRCRTACGLQEWDGYYSDSAFSGVLVRYTNDFEQVIVGQYFS